MSNCYRYVYHESKVILYTYAEFRCFGNIRKIVVEFQSTGLKGFLTIFVSFFDKSIYRCENKLWNHHCANHLVTPLI